MTATEGGLTKLYRSLTSFPSTLSRSNTSDSLLEATATSSREISLTENLPKLCQLHTVLLARGSRVEQLFKEDWEANFVTSSPYSHALRETTSDRNLSSSYPSIQDLLQPHASSVPPPTAGTPSPFTPLPSSHPVVKRRHLHPRRAEAAGSCAAVRDPAPSTREVFGIPGDWKSSQEKEVEQKSDTGWEAGANGSGSRNEAVGTPSMSKKGSGGEISSLPTGENEKPLEEIDTDVLKRAIVSLSTVLGKYIRVWITGGRLIVGVIAMIDRESNLVLSEAFEFEDLPKPTGGPESAPETTTSLSSSAYGGGGGGARSKIVTTYETPRFSTPKVFLGFVVILGRDIIKLELKTEDK